MACILTFSKRSIDPCDADVNEIDISDIAHSLSMLCRGGGQLPVFYSVAQHCVCCAKEALLRSYGKRVALACLLHDASEAYIADITRPVKARLNDYLVYEKALQDKIYQKYLSSLPTSEELDLIKKVDDCMLYHEFLPLMGKKLLDYEPEIMTELDFSFSGFGAYERKYLEMFRYLNGE